MATRTPGGKFRGLLAMPALLMTMLLWVGIAEVELSWISAFEPDLMGWTYLWSLALIAVSVGLHATWAYVYHRPDSHDRFLGTAGLVVGGGTWGYIFYISDPIQSMHILGGNGALALSAAGLFVGFNVLAIVCSIIGHSRNNLPAAQPARAQAAPPQPATSPPPDPAGSYPARAPRFNFSAMHGNADLKGELIKAATEYRTQGRNGLLLYGAPGTGKTMAAEALAGQLGIRFLPVTFGVIASKWINQTTEQLVEIFRAAHAQGPVLLFLDELDAIITDRRDGDGGYAEYQRVTTTFLTEAANVRGSNVLLVAATNYLDRLDDAAIRAGRFDFKVEVPLPDAEARRYLIEQELVSNRCQALDGTLTRLVDRWAGFDVPRIQLVANRACEARQKDPGKLSTQGLPLLGFDDFYAALRGVQGKKAGAPDGAKRLSDIYMDAYPKQQLEDVVAYLTHVEAFETAGGTPIKGILFFGPPGTGKTATAMALARESGWTFIQRRGRDLLTHGAIDALREEASDLRPAIVFLDEADDILANRQMSGYKGATNELLTLIDGAGGTLRDVVWVAATNHIDSIDAAALRGGRFEIKVQFGPPGEAVMRTLLTDWAGVNAKIIDAAPDAWAHVVCERLVGRTPADAYSALRNANNKAVARSISNEGAGRAVTPADVAVSLAEIEAR